MTEVEVPTEEYYESLRADMAERQSKVCPRALDRLLSLEAFLGVSLASGVAGGGQAARALRGPRGRRWRRRASSGQQGLRASHVQQFAGSANWSRQHAREA
eukprot:4094088-Alexandrium_andersonii.AAC.1